MFTLLLRGNPMWVIGFLIGVVIAPAHGEPTDSVRQRGEQHYRTLERLATAGHDSDVSELAAAFSASMGAERIRQTVLQLRKELAGGVVHGHEWVNDTTLSVEFRNCWIGPKMIVVLGLDPNPPHQIVKAVGHAELRPRAEPMAGGVTGSGLAERAGSLLSQMDSEGTFSGAVGIELDGAIVFRQAVGMAEKRWEIGNTPGTRFNTASMSKMFTAAAVLRLVGDGRVDLDSTVGTYIPEIRETPVGTQVTVRHLLTHTSGMGDIWTEEFRRDRPALRTPEALLPCYINQPLLFEPGTRWSYSNAGFALLGVLIERSTGEDLERAVARLVFEPAGMSRTGWYEVDDPSIRDLATGYTRHPAGYSRMYQVKGHRYSNIMVARPRGGGGGGAFTTVDDMLDFGRAMEAGNVLGEDLRRLALRRIPGTVRTHWQGDYGLGFAVGGEGQTRWWGHTGGAEGVSASFRVYPELGLTIIALSNYEEAAAVLGAHLYSAVEASIVASD